MLDQNIIEQLKSVFSPLENNIELVVKHSEHPKHGELISMLEGVASTSSKISMSVSEKTSLVPEFSIKNTGINFIGIPGGHEFSSLILGILNTDGKGKFPDKGLINRIKSLKGPIRLKTFISLSCENCPDVVQALNLMSIIHDDFEHTMVDGEFAQEEIEELKIQGVPSLVQDKNLLSSGKTQLSELLEKLESTFGANEVKNENLGEYDVVVIGGGPSGASAAIYSARKGLKTAVIAEKLGGQVQDTKGIENLISVPYIEGPQLAAEFSKHMNEYEIDIFEHRRVDKVDNGDIKNMALSSGESLSTKSIIVATGAKWRRLNVEGEAEYIGRGVAFCPHCDGPYYKGKDVAVIGGGNSGVEAAIDLANIVKSVVVFEFADELKADQVLVDKLHSLTNVKVVTNAQTSKVVGDGDKVIGLRYFDRVSEEEIEVNLDGVFVQIGLIPNSAFINELVETNKFGEIITDTKGRTNIKGIYAAGDVTTTPYKQIIISMGEGARSALTAFEELMV